MKDVVIVDEENLRKKIELIKKGGVSNLHIVSDFDRTLTHAFVEERHVNTSFAHIREGKYLAADYADRANALYAEYHPIEISEELSMEVKIKKMKEWWSKHLSLFIECGMNHDVIRDIIQKNKIHLRGGAKEFFDFLAQHHIPIVIFSAGIGNMIEEELHYRGLLHHNAHIISNFFEYDSHGKAKGYKSSIIHVFNKNEGQIKNSPYYEQIKHRKNVILLGDGIGDVGMLEGLSHETVLKIGFLNENIEKLKPQFQKEFDIVILGDGSLEPVNNLLKELL
jgi:5'-nucleotidase